MNRMLTVTTIVVAGGWTGNSAAQTDHAPSEKMSHATTPSCSGPWDPETVVRCALAASPELRQAHAELDAAAGRRTTAGVILPSNPTLTGTISNRRRPPTPERLSVLNWSAAVSQEIEIAGQRGARLDSAEAEVAARSRRVVVAEQEVAAAALTAYFETIAAEEAVQFATALAKSAESLAAYAEGRAKEAVLAGVEADVARAEATRIGLVRFEAERRRADALAALALMLGVQAERVQGGASRLPTSLPEIPGGALQEQALRLRGEIAAAEMERRVLESRLAVIRRERVPNPTISAFVERGEINDRIFGVGLSIPMPLPQPVGRTRAGEIAETLAQIRAAESSEELVRRRVRLEVARAEAGLRARRAAAGLFTMDQLVRARNDLVGLREAISSRLVSLREAIPWQRSLIELLQADIEARLAQALAWVELRRVVGLPLVARQGESR